MEKEKAIHTHTYTHRGILFSHKRKEILSFVTTWMTLEGITLSKIRDKDGQILHGITYVKSKKKKK